MSELEEKRRQRDNEAYRFVRATAHDVFTECVNTGTAIAARNERGDFPEECNLAAAIERAMVLLAKRLLEGTEAT